MSKNSHDHQSTPEHPLGQPQENQCAWCRCLVDTKNDPIGEPLKTLLTTASHGICNACLTAHFPKQAKASRKKRTP